MYKAIITSLICSILILGISCSSENSKKTEQQVFEDIFPELVEKTFKDFRKLPVPPPPPKNNSEEELDKMNLAFVKAKEDHKVYLDTTKFMPLYIVVHDSVIGHSKKKIKNLYGQYKESKLIDTSSYKKSFKIDLSQIDLGDDYVLKYHSDLTSSLDELQNKERLKYPNEERHLWQYSGIMYIYQVYFNDEQTYGVMEVGFNCGELCGDSYRVFVKKENSKWAIEKAEYLGSS